MEPKIYTILGSDGNPIGNETIEWSQIDIDFPGLILLNGHLYRQIDEDTLQLLR